jgi:hypothetical protein
MTVRRVTSGFQKVPDHFVERDGVRAGQFNQPRRASQRDRPPPPPPPRDPPPAEGRDALAPEKLPPPRYDGALLNDGALLLPLLKDGLIVGRLEVGMLGRL